MTSVFVAVIICEVLIGGALILTLMVPRLRMWPPPGKRSWQYWYTWILTIISTLGTLILGVLDWNHSVFDHELRFVPAGMWMVLGLALALWGVKSLGLYTTQGLKGDFVTMGAYRYSRNPQYVGDVVFLAGYALLCNSSLAFVTTALGIVLFLLTPFTEEPWLRERFGEQYDDYVAQVPRFISLRSRK
jgi:protein-S-isoprenylcysteine O-methyltransferase Ste14